ncbi:MAG: tyrosine-type recombinase/integrase [Nitrospira sp.]|nr:tyrosine-type recombinase/integrase [Nitrospira sp.]
MFPELPPPGLLVPDPDELSDPDGATQAPLPQADPAHRTRLRRLLSRYVGFCLANRAEGTTRVYKSGLLAFFRWWVAQYPTIALCPGLLHRYKYGLRADRDAEGLSLEARTINLYLAAVRGWCHWLRERQEIDWDASREIPDLKINQQTHQRLPLTPEQVGQLMAQFDDSVIGRRDAALTYLMVKTGIRAVQVQRADCGDLAQHQHKWVLRTQGKGRHTKDAFVVLRPEVVARLQQYLALRGTISPHDPLFARHHDRLTAYLTEQARREAPPGEDSRPTGPLLRLTTRAIQLRVTRAMDRASVRGNVENTPTGKTVGSHRRRQRTITPHSLRHTAATEAAQVCTPFEVQQMLDHADLRTTQKYFHAKDRLTQGAEQKITGY